jgi:hypothetical protein
MWHVMSVFDDALLKAFKKIGLHSFQQISVDFGDLLTDRFLQFI